MAAGVRHQCSINEGLIFSSFIDKHQCCNRLCVPHHMFSIDSNDSLKSLCLVAAGSLFHSFLFLWFYGTLNVSIVLHVSSCIVSVRRWSGAHLSPNVIDVTWNRNVVMEFRCNSPGDSHPNTLIYETFEALCFLFTSTSSLYLVVSCPQEPETDDDVTTRLQALFTYEYVPVHQRDEDWALTALRSRWLDLCELNLNWRTKQKHAGREKKRREEMRGGNSHRRWKVEQQ